MRKRFFLNCLLMLALVLVMSTSAFAISESDVESAVSASGKEAVSGNVLVWFLCAIAFLKVSQKIDSFLSSLGLNVGHTGAAEAVRIMHSSRRQPKRGGCRSLAARHQSRSGSRTRFPAASLSLPSCPPGILPRPGISSCCAASKMKRSSLPIQPAGRAANRAGNYPSF